MLIKICGITNLEDALLAVELGTNLIGFNFYESSSRYIAPELAAKIIKYFSGDVLVAGIFVNMPIKELLHIVKITNIDLVQLHGDESVEYVKKISLPFIKAFRPSSEKDLENIYHFSDAYAILIDAYVANQYGGTGLKADWSLAKKISKMQPTILAGGLNQTNVREAIHYIQPMGIDVCSGVEVFPGKKSPEKLKGFFNIIKSETIL